MERAELLTTQDVARILRRSPRTISMWRSENRGPRFSRLSGRGVVYDAADVRAYVERYAVDPEAERRD